MKRFPYILCIVFPVFVWACHTSRQTIGEARENRVHSIDRDLHVVIDSLSRNEWSVLTEWDWQVPYNLVRRRYRTIVVQRIWTFIECRGMS